MAAGGDGAGRDGVLSERVVVTGVAGLIGPHLARALLEKGHEVVGVDDLSQGRRVNLASCVEHPSFRFHEADVRDLGSMERLTAGASTLVHLAALKIPRYTGYLATLEVNGRGTEVVLECARRHGARMLFASTDDVYGKNPDPRFSEESTLVLGDSKINRWASAVSKVYGEHLCFAYAESHGVPVSIVRYSGIYGPTYQLSRLSGPQDIFIHAALTDQPMPIHGDGTQTRPFAHVSDAVEATLRVLEAPYAEGEVVNVGAADHLSIVNLAYLVWRLAGARTRPRLRFVPYTDFSRGYEDPRQRTVDIGKAECLLGWRPRIDVGEGMRRQVEWFREHLEEIRQANPGFTLEDER
ncbi:MAG: nucleoside-diphosphate sugar epimerase [Acidobacteria bacterium]|nr:MAG: nucleoside-diphosphate sugar epimerase [Acidobacteriota bacterium]